MRKLVTVRTVKEINPIPNADAIEVATVDGWKCVVKKGEFQPGDRGVYFEIDSIVPDIEPFAFLKHYNFRVRTIKLRGQVSQGLMMPFNVLGLNADEYNIGDELTEKLGVVKYDPPIPVGTNVVGPFPVYIRKTDQERIQNIYNEVDRSRAYEATEKLDGMSVTYFYYAPDNKFGVCSRNWEVKCEGVFEEINIKYQIEKTLRKNGNSIAIQGEMIGPGIQGNYYGLPKVDFRVFDIFDIDEQDYYYPSLRDNYCLLEGLSHVPIIMPFIHLDSRVDLDTLLEMANGKSVLANKDREGLVFKNPNGSFKVISNQFLLKEK